MANRDTLLNYGKQTVGKDDIQAVIDVLKEDKYLTTGSRVILFEHKLAELTGLKYGVAVANGTAALHCAIYAANIHEGDEVIVTTMSFVASANCIVYQGGVPIFVDIDYDTMNIDINKIEKSITSKTKAIISVDFAGQLCNYIGLRKICNKYNLILIQDASHSIGVTTSEQGDLVTFSFHPVKNITTGEGGAIVTDNQEFANRMKMFRSHGVDDDYKSRHLHYYSMKELGYNYRLTDIQCALGISQLNKLSYFIETRKYIAKKYNDAFKDFSDYLLPLTQKQNCAYHIYVIKLNLNNLTKDRDYVYSKLREYNIGVNVHYKPIHLQEYYISNCYTHVGLCPVSEDVYEQILTLPLYPTMSPNDVDDVISSVKSVINEIKK
jgi:dTDP-4-amino-4,6-dideoxygalactose transaminase